MTTTGIGRRQALAGAAALLAGQHAAGAAADARPESNADAPRRFELGLVSYNLAAGWTLAETLEFCRAAQVKAVECRTTHRHGVEPGLTAPQRREVRRRFADAGVTFWGCGSVCEFHAPDAATVAANVATCKKFVDLVAELGGRGVKVRPNALVKGEPPAATVKRIGAALAECGAAAQAAGIEIWVEVHGPGTAEPQVMADIMAACGHPSVGVTWNSNDGEAKGGTIRPGFALLERHVRSCHINDLGKDARKVYPYRELFAELRRIGYDRYTLIEVGKGMPYGPAALEWGRAYRRLWDELSGSRA